VDAKRENRIVDSSDLGECQFDVVVDSVDSGPVLSLRQTFLRDRQR